MLETIASLPQQERETLQNSLVLLSGDANRPLGEAVAKELGVELGEVELRWHPSSEPYVRVGESVRGKHVFALQSHVASGGQSGGDHLIQHIEIISAARRAHSKRVIAMAPYLYGSRQDRRSKAREAVTVRNTIKFIEGVGPYSLNTIDLHTPQSIEIFDGPSDHFTAHIVLSDRITPLLPEDTDKWVVVTPDAGRVKLAEIHARSRKSEQDLPARIINLNKDREEHNTGKVKHKRAWLPDLEGTIAVMPDDILDRASTAVSAADLVHAAGAKTIYLAVTHGFFNEPANERIEGSKIDKIFVTDTVSNVANAKQALGDRVEVVSMAQMLAGAIVEIALDGSLDEYFQGKQYR